jgi:hypothetical protein
MPTSAHRYGSLAQRNFRPRLRTASRNDHIHLFSSPVNAARLREALDDSRAGRNLIAVTIEELEALFNREAM